MTARWPHQAFGVAEVLKAIDAGQRRIVLTSPTGGGKSLMMTDLIEAWASAGLRVALYSNRKMLTEQTARVLDKAGIDYAVRASGWTGDDFQPVQLCSIQTEDARVLRGKKHELHRADRVLIDEVHQCTGPVAQAIMGEHLQSGAAVVGVTATPLGLGGLFERLVVAGTTSELRACGALVPCRIYGPDEPDLKEREKSGDVTEKQARSWIMRDGIFGRVLHWFDKLNPTRRPSILFAPGVKESLWFAEQFHQAGITAAHIDGDDVWINGTFQKAGARSRSTVLKGSKDGSITVICNRFVLREGIDAPWLAHGIFATVFGSLQSYLQSGGRLLRAHPGLTEVTVQDHGGCLDEQTQILTGRGWFGMNDVCADDDIATMNLETGSMEWCHNEGTIKKPLDSGMVHATCAHIDLRVTDYHQMVMRADGRRGDWKKVDAKTLVERGSNWIIPTSAVENVPPCELTEHELGFIGWFFTDGCMDGARIRIYQSANSPAHHHEHILECLEGCGFRYGVRERTRPSPFSGNPSTEMIYAVSSGHKSERGWSRLTPWLDKSFPLEHFNKLDRRQFGVLLHAMNLGDGCKAYDYNQRTLEIAVASSTVADRIQSLAVRRGYRCNVSLRKQVQNGKERSINILRIRDSQLATVCKGEMQDSYISVSEWVWCVQTRNGTLFARRGGKVCIMGNSYWRHGSLNADRHWSLSHTASIAAGLREEELRADREKQPTRCPQCAMILLPRNGWIKCPCGWQAASGKRSRMVVQSDGQLKELANDIYRPRRVCAKPDGPQLWRQMYFRARSKKWNATFRQAFALFAEENHWGYPDKNWPLMPISLIDEFRRVADVPPERLTQ